MSGNIYLVITSCKNSVQNISALDGKFARFFVSWTLQPKSTSVKKSVAIGHSNKPVMLALVVSFLK